MSASFTATATATANANSLATASVSAPVVVVRPGSGAARQTRQVSTRPAALRGLLLLGCVISAAMAFRLGDPTAYLAADPELAQLLRGMAVIKAGIVIAAIGVLLWRFGRPMSPPLAAIYLVGAWLLSAATLLVWQLTLIPLAAIGFHAAELSLLVVAWRDTRDPPSAGQVGTQRVRVFRAHRSSAPEGV
jgi:hypothetical protein